MPPLPSHPVRRAHSLSQSLWLGAGLTTLAWVTTVALSAAHRLWAGEALGWDLLLSIPVDAFVLASLPLAAGCLVIERFTTRAPRRLGEVLRRNRYDLFFTLLQATGANLSLQVLFSVGLSVWIGAMAFPTPLHLADRLPWWAGAPLFWSLGTFIQYWVHRWMHSRLMWPLHAIHHAATDMTALTDARNHPLEDALQGMLVNPILAFAGFRPEVMFAVGMVALLCSKLTHSNLPFPRWLERSFVAGPAVHRVHHARDVEYHDRNFSLMPVWDRLFGTFALPEHARHLSTGVDDPRFDTGRPLHDLSTSLRIWLAGLGAAIGRRLGRRSPESHLAATQRA